MPTHRNPFPGYADRLSGSLLLLTTTYMARENSSSNRGFAAMDENRQREIASRGGSASGGNFANDPARAAEAGRRGGQASHGGRGRSENNE